jgi:hypothetical protein
MDAEKRNRGTGGKDREPAGHDRRRAGDDDGAP